MYCFYSNYRICIHWFCSTEELLPPENLEEMWHELLEESAACDIFRFKRSSRAGTNIPVPIMQ